MLDSRNSPAPLVGNARSKMATALFFICSCMPTFAEELEFTTSDGKYTARGKISSFIDSDGKTTKLPRSLNLKTQVIIELPNGIKTSPIPLSQLSKSTRAKISDHVVSQRKLVVDDKPIVTTATKNLLDQQEKLEALIEQYSGLGPMNEVESFEKEQYLEEIQNYKKDIGRNAAEDWAIRLILTYLEGEYGENKYGSTYLIAKDTQHFWPAWQAATIFSLRYRESIAGTIKLMDQYLAELGQVAKKKPGEGDATELRNAGQAALWLREAAAIIENSGLANDKELKRLKQIQISTTVVSLIKNGEIPDDALDKAAQRRLEIEEQQRKKRAEEARIKALAKDKKIAECKRILEQFMEEYDRQWEYGLEAFDRQAIITADAKRYLEEADLRFQISARQSFEWSVRANVDLGDDPTDEEIREKRRAEELATFYRAEEYRDYRECTLRLNQLNLERQRLAQAHAILANFVNQGKNKMILFENNYLEAIQDDNALKTVYLDFTEKMKAVIAKFPPMPTVSVPSRPDPRLEERAISEAKRGQVRDLSFDLTVDIQQFLTRLVSP